MNFSEPFIKRPVMTILVMFSLFLAGFYGYATLPVSDLPDISMPTIQVSTGYPGASPETMANAVTTPLENQFMTVEGIESIFSSSQLGSSTIVLQFELERNIDQATTDVQAAISRATPNLPENLPTPPTYQKVNPADSPILYYAVASDNMTLGELFDFGDNVLGNRIAMTNGVSQVFTYGYPYAVRIQVDPEKLAAKNMGLDEFVNAIANSNVDLPLGTLYGHENDFTIEADGQVMNAEGYNKLIVKNKKGELVRLSDVANALDSTQNDKYCQNYITQQGSSPCIVLGVRKTPGSNTVQIADDIHKLIGEMKNDLPGSIRIEEIYDASIAIRESVHDVTFTLIIAFFLVVTVIFLSLGKWQNTIIPTLSLPMTIFATFALMYALHFSLDILSLLALTLSVGFLVDDAIVVLENNVRHVQLGENPFDAAIKGSKEIGTTVLSMTLCLTAAFIPLTFMSGVVGRLFREFGLTIIIAVLLSGFIALTFIPMLSARLVQNYEEEKTVSRLHKIYEPAIHWAMRRKWAMLGTGLFCVAASLFLFVHLPKDFLPPDDVGFLRGYTQSRDGTSPDLMCKYHAEIDKIVMDDPNVDALLSINSNGNTNEGFVFLTLKPYKARASMTQVVRELSQKLQEIPGIETFLSPIPLIKLQTGTTATAPYQYSLTSIDPNALFECAPKVLATLRNHPKFTQTASDLRIHQPHWNLRILRDKASFYNVDANAIETYLTYAYSGGKISQINGNLSQYDVIVETLPRFYRDPDALSKLYVSSRAGYQVPLSELVETTETVGPLTINHMNGLTSVGISFDLPEGVPLGDAVAVLENLELPPEVHGSMEGTAKVFQSSTKSLTLLFLLAIFTIYVILGILYESFIHPLTVMSALPPALFGGLFTLYVFNETLSLYSFVGLILLIGIVLKNGIMMVDFALASNKPPKEAIIEASLIRLRPILMTTACALMGAIPIAFGIGGAISQTRRGLGLCILGGLLISQLLTLLLTPVLYYYFALLQTKLTKSK